jgi:hypothetical protein
VLLHAMGAIGPVLLLGAYYLVSTGRVSGRSKSYQAMNLVGSGVLVAYSTVFEAWVSVALNVAWGLIAAYELLVRRR